MKKLISFLVIFAMCLSLSPVIGLEIHGPSRMTGSLDMNNNYIINALNSTTGQGVVPYSQMIGYIANAANSTTSQGLVPYSQMAGYVAAAPNATTSQGLVPYSQMVGYVSSASIGVHQIDSSDGSLGGNLNFGSHKAIGLSNGTSGQDAVTLSQMQDANGVINIIDYGAVGDNSTDNSVALQAAFDAGMATQKPVYVPVGVYNHATPLRIYAASGMNLRGNSMTLGNVDGTSVLHYTGTGAGILINDTPDEWLYSIDFRDIVFWGNYHNTGIYDDHLSESFFSHVEFFRYDTAIKADEMDITTFDKCAVADCKFGFVIENAAFLTFRELNIWNVTDAFDLNLARRVSIESSHCEKFKNIVHIYNNLSESLVSSLNIVGNDFSNGDSMNIDSRIIRAKALSTTNPLLLLNVVVRDNYVAMYDATYQFDILSAATSGSHYGYVTLAGNTFEFLKTAVIYSDTDIYRWYVENNRLYAGVPYVAGTAGWQIGGSDHSYYGDIQRGPIILSSEAGYVEGSIWYDYSAHVLKYIDNAGTKTVSHT